MRYILFLLSVCLATQVWSRPPLDIEAENSEGEHAEYETGGAEAETDDSLQEDGELRAEPQETVEDEEEEEQPEHNQRLREDKDNSYSQRVTEEQQPARSKPFYKSYKNGNAQEAIDSNEDYETPAKEREANRNTDKVEKQPEVMPDFNQDNALKSPHNNDELYINKRTSVSQAPSNEEGDLLFESDQSTVQREKSDKKDYNKEIADPRDQYSRRYYNSMQKDAGNAERYQNHGNLNRDRRAAQTTNETNAHMTSNNNLELENNAESEEAAIKRHVKKLSSAELDELLNSLTEDKKDLLKKIMESGAETENDINKREITKKAGAAPDENGNLESVQQLESSSKLQEANSGSASNSQTPSNELIETSKQPDPQSDNIINILPSKILQTSNESSSASNKNENKAELTGQDTVLQLKLDTSNTVLPVLDPNSVKIDGNSQEPSKSANKREANMEEELFYESKYLENSDFKDTQDLSNVPKYFCGQSEDFSQLDESQLNNNDGNIMKREALDKDTELSESIKSLEESFPNSHSYDDNDPYSDSDMAPLVRVKRKNTDLSIKKRAAGILPDPKVAYFPYRAENDDEDNDEGNEFDDDGFYDRTSNLAKSDSKDPSEDETPDKLEQNQQLEDSKTDKLTQNNNKQSDTMNLGSDTDSVLSGVEGVDDNLMFNSDSRNRRTVKSAFKEHEQEQNLHLHSTPTADEQTESASENNMNAPSYDENDAFGPLPRSYEGEVSRYKRVRHVKQPTLQEMTRN